MKKKMKDPYKVLGLKKGASQEEIREAYKKLVKKYHPDQYANNPLSDLAEEKLEEINKAYNYLMNEGSGQGARGFNNNYQHYGHSQFIQVRDLINRNQLQEAERVLDRIGQRDAEWHFLKGIIYMRRGWYDQGYQYIRRAVSMDPGNEEYRATLDNINYQASSYRSAGRGSHGDGCDACDVCTCLLCSDCCCECMGGDLITCC
ncbi:MAG: DnaJ domain-containing protein [Halanaerobiales bacterium]